MNTHFKLAAAIALIGLGISGCGPSDNEISKAKSLGFDSFDEMKHLTALGFQDKGSYIDAVSRTPTFCYESRDLYTGRCQWKKVVWVVEITDNSSAGKDRARVLDSSGNSIQSIDVFSAGKNTPDRFAKYLVVGTAGSLNSFYPDLTDTVYVKKISDAEAASTYESLAKVAQIKTDKAISLGFQSASEMDELTARGFKTKQEYLEAKQKAEEDDKKAKYEAKLKDYMNNKGTIDWISNKVGGYKGSAKCKVVLDLIELSMVEKGFTNNDAYKPTREKYELVDVKALSEGTSQEDIDNAYSNTMKAFADRKNPAQGLDCYKIVEMAPK